MCIEQQGNINPFPKVRPSNPKGVHLGHSILIIVHIWGSAFGELFTPRSLHLHSSAVSRSKANIGTTTRPIGRSHTTVISLSPGEFPVWYGDEPSLTRWHDPLSKQVGHRHPSVQEESVGRSPPHRASIGNKRYGVAEMTFRFSA